MHFELLLTRVNLEQGKAHRWLRYARSPIVCSTLQKLNSGVSNNTMAVGGVISLIGLLTGNKGMVQAGLGIAGVGVTGKILNRA